MQGKDWKLDEECGWFVFVDKDGKVLTDDHDRPILVADSDTLTDIVDALLAERRQLADALTEALDGWDGAGCTAYADHTHPDQSRIAELRKLGAAKP